MYLYKALLFLSIARSVAAFASHSLRMSVDTGQQESWSPLRDVIVEKLQQVGAGNVKSVKEISPGPGLHNRHFLYDTTEGKFFAKVSKGAVDNFASEMESLKAINACKCLKAPVPLGYGTMPLGGSYLIMEYLPFIPFGQSIPSVVEKLGENLAYMHQVDPPVSPNVNLQSPPKKWRYGFDHNVYLGSSLQDNTWGEDFSDFFLNQRLVPQIINATEKFSDDYGTSNEDSRALYRLGDSVCDEAREVLLPVKDMKPSLLHGDLWIGNSGAIPGSGRDRIPAVFDPSCWYGPAEFDLAISGLFGGFAPPFLNAYHKILPKSEGFDRRMKVYRLFHMLNHLNLHGAGYSSKGTTEEPDGYYEKVVKLMEDIVQHK